MLISPPRPFVPNPDSDAVAKLRHRLGVDKPARKVRVVVGPNAKEKNCFLNVRERVERYGGRIQFGWVIWQHANLFIEGEPHAVHDPGVGHGWVDCTPHLMPDGRPCREIVFIPNDEGSYDFGTTDIPDNVRVALLDDPRIHEALKLWSERTRVMNGVPAIDCALPAEVAEKVHRLERRATLLLVEAMQPSGFWPPTGNVGRNDPCPCGSGTKYKKCHGR